MKTKPYSGNPRRWIVLAAIWVACGPICIAGATAPVAKDFDSLGDAADFIPPESPILAFEENACFLYAVCDLSKGIPHSDAAGGVEGTPSWIRRYIFLKPSIWVVEDIADRKIPEVPDIDDVLSCEVFWPAAESPQPQSDSNGDIRRLRVIQPSSAGTSAPSGKAVLANNEDRFDLAVTSADRVYRLDLPLPKNGAGRISVADTQGKTLISRRPLPSGVLPHGEEGMKLLDKWDQYYRDGRFPPWNSGMAAPDLREAVERGDIQPCRVIDLGCGSGDNAIYLAKKGFEVTAVDLAPTALGIAEADAEKQGVKVVWMLADVLALPEMEKFDLIFDRGCYHNVRYVDAEGFVTSLDKSSRPGTRFFVLSCNRDSAPGVREQTMRADFSELFEFEWLRESYILTGKDGSQKHPSWNAMLRRKGEAK